MGQQLCSNDVAKRAREELKLKPWLFRIKEGSNSSNGFLSRTPAEIKCLVHCEWLDSICNGRTPPKVVHELLPEEADLYLQDSCHLQLPPSWRLISVCIIGRSIQEDVDRSDSSPSGLLQPLPCIPTDSVWEFFSHTAYYNQRLQWVGEAEGDSLCGGIQMKPPRLTRALFHAVVRELYSVSVTPLTANADPQPSSPDTSPQEAVTETYSHPNLSPLLAALESETSFYLIHPHEPFVLRDLAMHSPAVLKGKETQFQFILYQMFQLLKFLHEKGVYLGEVGLGDIHVDNCLWVHFRLPQCGLRVESSSLAVAEAHDASKMLEEDGLAAEASSSQQEEGASESEGGEGHIWGSVPNLPLQEALLRWQRGELGNFDYLMILNFAAGRRMEDSNNHPILPWVTDFHNPSGSWRDLTKTKHRLTKGDRQMDFAYQGAKDEIVLNPDSSVVPHHVGDLLTDVTYYMYMARKTPKEVLCSRVRPNWVPGEYPSSIEHIYHWTPDECIPEFYCDPSVFHSIHKDLPDLVVPTWSTSTEDFVVQHRAMLESDYVSAHLHSWIDLTFGSKLTGEAAMKARNVHLAIEDSHRRLSAYGVVQLFEYPHPRRLINSQSAPYTLEHPIHDLHPAIHERHKKHTTSEAGTTEEGSLEEVNRGPYEPHSGGNEEDSSEANFEHSASTKLVFKDVDLGDVNTHRLTPYSIGDDSFEDLTMVADFSSSREGPKSVEETDFGPASYSDAAYMFATSAPKLMRETIAEAPAKGKLPTAIAGIPVPFRRRGHQATETEEYSWKGEQIPLPKEFNPLTRLQRLEETSSFLLKSFQTQPPRSVLTDLWTTEELASFAADEHGSTATERAASTYFWETEGALSFEEEVSKDIVVITCLAAELFLYKHVKTTLCDGMALSQRVKLIRTLTESGRVRVPYFISSLVEYVFSHLDRATGPTSLGLPGHSVPLVLQQLVPIYYYPSYFTTMHQFLAGLVEEKQYLSCQLSAARKQCGGKNSTPHVSSMKAIDYVCRNWGRLVCLVDGQGLDMLLTHLIAFFELPFLRVEMVGCLFEEVTQYLSQALMVKYFLPLIQSLYDTPSDPHAYGVILHRPFLRCLINRFGLGIFIRYCLPYLRDTVIDPSSARFPYLQQRPISLLDSDSYGQQQRNSSKAKEREAVTFSMSLGDRAHPSTPPPSPMVDGSDIEEDEGDVYQEEGREGHAVYEEFSLLLQAEIHEKPENTSPQVSNASGSHLPQRLTSAELLAEEPVFLYQAPNPSEEDGYPSTFRRREPSQTSTSSQQTLANEEDRRKLDSSVSVPSGVVDPQEPTEKGNTRLDTPTQSLGVSEDTQLFNEDGLSHTGTDEGENEEQRGPELSHEVHTKDVDDRMIEVCDFLSRVALDSLQWLVQLLGPILTTRHIAQPLLNSLPRSFVNCLRGRVKSVPALECLSHVGLVYGDPVVMRLYLPQVEKWISNFEKQGRSQRSESSLAAAVCLLDMCLQSLEPVTLESNINSFATDYFTPLVHFVTSTKAVFTTGSEGRAFVCQAILQLLLTTCRLMGRERSFDFPELKQAVQVFFSTFDEVLSDPNASLPPSSLAVANIRDSLGPGPLEYNQEAMEQLKTVFAPTLARYAYVQFCHSIGQLKLDTWLYNAENIVRIAMIEELVGSELMFEQSIVASLVHSQQVLAEGSEETDSEEEGSDADDAVQLQQSFGPLQAHIETPALCADSTGKAPSLWFVPLKEEDGEDTGLQQAEATFWVRYKHAPASGTNTDHQLPMVTKNDPENRDLGLQQHELDGSWVEKWETELSTLEGVRQHPIALAGLRLQAFAGHKSTISKLLPIESKHIFISASRDRTIKLWSLSNHGNGEGISHPQLTYSLHQKAPVGLEYLPATDQVASCGTKLHIWDLETAYCVREYIPKTAQPYVAMTTIATPFPMLVLGTLDGRLQLVDVRSKELAQSWRMGVDSGNNVTLRKLATDQGSSWLAGVSTGSLVHTLDPRTGEVLKGWKAVEAGVGTVGSAVFGQEIVAVRATARGHIATGSGSGTLSLWTRRGELLQNRRDSPLVLQYFDIVGDQLVGISSGNHLVFYNDIDHHLAPPAKIFKLHNRFIRGTATVCTPLQHSRTLLLGNDAGQIVLMA